MHVREIENLSGPISTPLTQCVSIEPLVALPLLMSVCQRPCNVNEVPNVLGKLLEMVVFGLIPNGPVSDQCTKPIGMIKEL